MDREIEANPNPEPGTLTRNPNPEPGTLTLTGNPNPNWKRNPNYNSNPNINPNRYLGGGFENVELHRYASLRKGF